MARDYDPAVGRYVESDPIGLDGGVDTYAYAAQNPLESVDPTGTATAPAIPSPPPGFTLPGWIVIPSTRVLGVIGLVLSIPGDTPQSESRAIPQPAKPKCGCTCTCRADANDNIPGNIKPGDKTFAFGTATASNCADASKEAKRIATHSLGKQPKHVGCKCTES